MTVHSTLTYTSSEMMTIAAARLLKDEDVCFVGIGLPSAACNLARLTHAPGITLIYESGTIGTKPVVLPLSIGDGELCATALTTVSVPEVFRYWLQGGRISVGFLSGAQVDKFGNINTTTIGPYNAPKVRLPGSGGAPEIAVSCGQIFIIMRHSRRAFVEKLDFLTSLGYGRKPYERKKLGIKTLGPTVMITDLCVMRPEAGTNEFVVTSLHAGVTREQVRENTGWAVKFVDEISETLQPTEFELNVLRDLNLRTVQAHGGDVTSGSQTD